jgi:hypothetical protein
MREQFSLHVATAVVVSFFGERAVELSVFHFTTALIHRFAGYAAGCFVRCCKRRARKSHGQRSD